ncbi:unnamed protein product [Brassica oleracea]
MFLSLEGAGVNARVDNQLHQFFADIVDNTYTFQFELGEFNFTSKNPTFTTRSGIFTPDDGVRGELPVASTGNLNNVTAVASGGIAVVGETTNANHQPSSSDVPLPVRPASTNPVFEPNENGQKSGRKA